MSTANLDTEWEQLAARCGTPPFLRPAFFLATERWLAPRGEPHIACARRAGELVAILPLVRRGGRLAALHSVHTPRFDMTGTAEGAAELWRVLRDDHSWYVLELGSVPHDSLIVTELARRARQDGFRVEVRHRSEAPFLALDGLDRTLDGHFRRNLMQRRRKLPDLELERVSANDEAAVDDLIRLEAAAWKGQAGTAIASSAETVGFYRELAARFAACGALALTFLRSGGRRISAHFALEHAGTYYLLKPGYDPEYSRFGPGHLHVYEAALDAGRRGLREIDLLGQNMEWKRNWTSQARPQVSVELYRPTMRGAALHAMRYRARPALAVARRRLARAQGNAASAD